MAAPRFAGFGPGLAEFLVELSQHNDRAWFEANRDRYEANVREPARAFIRAMAPRLREVSAQLTADDRKVGGSLMRVHRDVRFSKDKTPYKTNLGVQFRHRLGKDVHAPGAYVHVGTDGVFLGMGMWRPDGPSLAEIRGAIDGDPRRWKRVSRARRLTEVWRPAGDSLKRAPKGYPADHPLIEDLRRKDFILVRDLELRDVEGPEVVDLAISSFARAKSYVRFLCDAIGVPF